MASCTSRQQCQIKKDLLCVIDEALSFYNECMWNLCAINVCVNLSMVNLLGIELGEMTFSKILVS